jgi:hypothetical protein
VSVIGYEHKKKGLHGRYGIFCFKGLPILYDARRVWACMGSTGYQYVMCVIQPSHFLLLGLLDTAAFCWQNIPAVISQRGCNKRHLKLGLLKCGSRPAVHHTFVGWTSNFHPICIPQNGVHRGPRLPIAPWNIPWVTSRDLPPSLAVSDWAFGSQHSDHQGWAKFGKEGDGWASKFGSMNWWFEMIYPLKMVILP